MLCNQPPEIVESIICRLHPSDAISLSLSCKDLNSLCISDKYWKHQFESKWGNRSRRSPTKDFMREYAVGVENHRHETRLFLSYLKNSIKNESMEVGGYQRAIHSLTSLKWDPEDVTGILLTPDQSVLINLIAVHYLLRNLHVKKAEVESIIKQREVANRQVCLRWWNMGSMARVGFRLKDELHVLNSSLVSLCTSENHKVLEVLSRGVMHETLRVQISADFASSVWVGSYGCPQ